jgi:hypothetical protein
MRSLTLLALLVPTVATASGGGADADLMPAPERDAIEAGMHAAESGVPPYDELMIIADSVYDYITDKLTEEFSRSAAAATEPAASEPAPAQACLDLMDDVYTLCEESTATTFIEGLGARARASTCEDLSVELDGVFVVLDALSWDSSSLWLTDELFCMRSE